MNEKRIIIILALVFGSLAAHAQYLSNNGLFEVDQIKGCAPLTVNVVVRPPAICDNGANPCDMDYLGNNGFQNGLYTFTYTTAGTYQLRVLTQTYGSDVITINVAPNNPPAFNVYSCGNNSVQVVVTDDTYDQFVINYNDGSPDVVVPKGSLAKDSHTYPAPGNKNITVRGRNLGADDNCNPATQTINALTVLPAPTITQLSVLDVNSLRLDFNNLPNILYKLEIAPSNGTAFQFYQDIYNTSTFTAPNLKPDNAYYCFRLGAFDPCLNTTVYSNVICSTDLDVTAKNGLNTLNWATFAVAGSSYSITKTNASNLSATPPINSLDDNDLICGLNYCYRMTTTYPNGSTSTSLEKCVTAFSTTIPSTTENISTQVTGLNSIDLIWTQDPAFNPTTYTILKGGNILSTSTTTTFSDTGFVPDTQLCYAISYEDACGNKSLTSAVACALSVGASLAPDNAITLTWNAYTGWRNGVDHYVVEKFDPDGTLLQSFDTGTSTTLLDNAPDPANQIYVYRVTAYARDIGVSESISNNVTVIKGPNLFHPKAFTPNGDGLNDTFEVYGQYTETVEFKIFSRWGELLFFTTDLGQSWDGSYKGNLMPEGTYTFRAFLTDYAGRTFERSGNVVLLRKQP